METAMNYLPEIVSGLLTGDAHVSCWPFCPVPSKSSRSLCETYLAHFPSGFQSSELLPKKSNIVFAFFRERGYWGWVSSASFYTYSPA